jgi:hypothetical protein
MNWAHGEEEGMTNAFRRRGRNTNTMRRVEQPAPSEATFNPLIHLTVVIKRTNRTRDWKVDSHNG